MRRRQDISFDSCDSFSSPSLQGVHDASPHLAENIGGSSAPKMPLCGRRPGGDVLRSNVPLMKGIQGKF